MYCMGRGSHTVYLEHGNSKGVARGRRQKSTTKYGREHEHYKGKSPKKDLTSAKDLPMELTESPYHRLV